LIVLAGVDTRAGRKEGDQMADPPGTPEARTSDREGRLWLGAVLVALGVLFLLGQYVPDLGRFVPLLVGLALLGVFFATRAYGFLIPGGIVTGVGAGIVLAEAVPGAGGLFLISLGAGFALIWVVGSLLRLPENHWWPLVPAAIVATIGLVDLAGEQGQLREALRIGWPLLLISIGAIVILRARSGRRAGPGV
jgi:hypothetical protein